MPVETLDSAQAPAAARRATRTAPYRVVVHGLTYFCRQLPGLLGSDEWDIRDRSQHSPTELVRLTRDLAGCDLAFSWGGRIDMGRFLWGARLLGARRVVIFWCGSDVLRARAISAQRGVDSWIAQQIHWAASPSLAREVNELGVECDYVQASFVRPVDSPQPLPKQFSVLVFLPRPDLADLYGWDRIVHAARALPEVRFNLVGLREGTLHAPPNIVVHRWIPDLAAFYDSSTVVWRPVRHDAGIAFMVLEAMAHGRYVLYTYPIAGATQVRDELDAVRELVRLKALHDAGALALNHAGRESVWRTYRRDVVRETLRNRWKELILSQDC